MSKTAIRSRRDASVGRAADGVVILRPAVRPQHFTQRQIEDTIRDMRDAFDRRANDSSETTARVPKSR
jgi:hypothetical protein